MCAKNTFLLDTLKDCRTRLEWSKEVQELQDVLTYCRILKPRFADILDFKTFPLVSYSYSLVSFDANRATIIFNFRYKHSYLCYKIYLARNTHFQLIGNLS